MLRHSKRPTSSDKDKGDTDSSIIFRREAIGNGNSYKITRKSMKRYNEELISQKEKSE